METNKILRNAVLTCIFFLPFITLFVANHLFFPFITGKNFAFRIIVEVITVLWFILALRDKSVLPKSSKLLWAFVAFVGVIFVSDIFSPNAFKSFWSNYERMEGWVTLAHLFALFVVTSSVMTRKVWEWFFRLSVGVSLLVAGYGMAQLAGVADIHQGGVRLDATLGNATYLAIYMVFHIFLNLLLLSWSEKGSIWRWVYWFAIATEAVILYNTATRGAILGLIGGLFLTGILVAIFEKKNPFLRKVAVGVVLALVLLVGIFTLFKSSDFVRNSPVMTRFSELSFSDKTTDSRFAIWGMAWEGFKERPILGWGQESFNYVFNKYYEPRMYAQEQWFDRTHNVFFDWLIAGGILGIISYLSLFVLALYYLLRKGSHFSSLEKSLLLGLFSAYFFHNLTVFDNITSYMMFVFVLAYIHSTVGGVNEKLAHSVSKIDSGTKNRVLIPLSCVLAVFVIYSVNVPAMLAASNLIYALSANKSGPQANVKYFKQAIGYDSFGRAEISEQLSQASSQAATMQNVDLKIKQELFDLAQGELAKQLDRAPEDARYYLFAGSLASSYGDSDNAIKYLQKARELSPKKQTLLFSLGSTYLGKGDFESGVKIMKEAFELDKSFKEARVMYGIALLYAKNKSEALEVLKELPKESALTDQRILQALYTGGYYQEALDSINFIIGKTPNNPAFYFSRAAILYKLGKPNQAIVDLNKVVELNPAVKGEIDGVINKIRTGQPI